MSLKSILLNNSDQQLLNSGFSGIDILNTVSGGYGGGPVDFASKTRETQPAAITPQTAPATMTDHSVRGVQLRLLSQLVQKGAQRRASDPLHIPVQREDLDEDKLQLKSSASVTVNRTGLPDNLKSGLESLSGMAMDHVQVHRNSSKPAQLNAHAFAQGSDIHLAPGQDQHLPHEAWHVVQQAQGRVKPTMHMKDGVPINDDEGLEREADVMGARAAMSGRAAHQMMPAPVSNHGRQAQMAIQRVMHGVPPFVIHEIAVLSPAASARLPSVATTLSAALNADAAVQIQQLIISVEREGGGDYQGGASTIVGDNPAQTTTLPTLPHASIEITLQRPFAEAASEGELLGMLAHEIGAHNIPSDFRGVVDAGVAVFAPVHTARKVAKANTPSGGYEFHNWPAPAPGAAPDNWDGDRQHDHVMLADTLRNPPPAPAPVGAAAVPMPLTRANVYFQTVLNIGDQIWNDAAKTPAEKLQQTSDLVHLYLVYTARVIASDDGRMPPARHGLALNDVYGEVFTQVILPYRPGHPWIPAARPKGNPFTLAASLIAFIGKVKLEKRRNG